VPKVLSPAEIDAFRERLCDVAEKMFADHGPDGVTLRQLTGALGVSSMTPYRYFRDKDAILAAVRARAFDRFADAMEKAAPARRGGDAYFAFARANPAAYKLMFDTQQPTFTSYAELLGAMDRARKTLRTGKLRDLAAKGWRRKDIELHAFTYWSILHGAVMLELVGALSPPLNARAVARPALEAFWAAIGLSET
jgi:AcrR family transcriptional regulator